MLEIYGNTGTKYDGNNKPIALFDWDNTVIKNDIGDAMFFYMARGGLFRMPHDWRSTSAYLSVHALERLTLVCPIKESEFLATGENKVCHDLLMSIYMDKNLDDGAQAFDENYHKDTMEPSLAWAAQLLLGYSPDEIRQLAHDAINELLHNPVVEGKNYLRIYAAIKKLIGELKAHGFDVWIVSASSQYIVEPFAKHVDISPDRVIGIRSFLDDNQKITPRFIGCGTHRENNQSIITYRQGKRCFINKLIFGMTDPQKMMNERSPTIFAAGDSDSDVFFLQDARVLKLVIDRNLKNL